MPMDYEKYKPTRVSEEAHARLKEYCEKTGRLQVEVVSELIMDKLEEKSKTDGKNLFWR